ncbi:tRNA (guanine-N(7)-)-methyltransferase-like isoform X2 [Hibiscus syriacus]|uniref:tRNA (guanine-N(7)-)-methyltransferase-like isoform X2 n=1 Tax=Hibiscus syriacus TaxID=106335 RepID=UPI0019244147|nr:tRNA (guanine-N(7)-)-methyltransferase-like isoform X2 [Hibiscus syriacus]
MITKSKKIIWIGPGKFSSSSPCTGGASKLAQMLYKQSQCNGLFIMGMAQSWKDLNFLGLETNGKLLICLDSVNQSGTMNRYLIGTNATSTFRSIVSSCPGELVLVSIQCPNPDFNKPENRWSMLQRSLIEAVADLLAHKGKVFLQSDVKAVAMRMKEQFFQYGKGKLHPSHDFHGVKINGNTWLEENPFGIRSDGQQHVIDQGAPKSYVQINAFQINWFLNKFLAFAGFETLPLAGTICMLLEDGSERNSASMALVLPPSWKFHRYMIRKTSLHGFRSHIIQSPAINMTFFPDAAPTVK